MRYRKILVSGSFLVMMCQQDDEFYAKCIKGLPKGSKFVYAISDTWNGIWIVVEHSSFSEIKDGDIIPELPRPEFEVI